MDPSAATPVATTKWPPTTAEFKESRSESSTGHPCATRSATAVNAGFSTLTSTPPAKSAARQRLTICSPESGLDQNPSQFWLPLESTVQSAFRNVLSVG